MTHEELTDDEALAAAMLLGFEWEPLDGYEIFGSTDYGVYNHPIGRLLAINRLSAARAYLKHHLPQKTPAP
ncbi:hypothetical protein CWO91_16660 [Bradyrhizobium genosp. SA-3]|uniref:hypothetical protein n=1 Tax=Bradyrhizobium genosp. SA-3 TaxID=508868 RepID=UPI0010295F86|nr:hypothetical protein [Bradyrhizobium genosp. SA-3]RZN09659.1 hypothetical protein CWO91_16660 [Bradyrhizobium genosp. SA-3]